MSNDPTLPTPGALERQLSELNNRSRWYASQRWQVPFAYITITALAVANSGAKPSIRLTCVLWASAIFGVCVILHWFAMLDGLSRAVRNLQSIERSLSLDVTARVKPSYVLLLAVALVLATVSYAIAAIHC